MTRVNLDVPFALKGEPGFEVYRQRSLRSYWRNPRKVCLSLLFVDCLEIDQSLGPSSCEANGSYWPWLYEHAVRVRGALEPAEIAVGAAGCRHSHSSRSSSPGPRLRSRGQPCKRKGVLR